MKLKNGRITMLASEDGMKIELHDNDASITFAHIKLTPIQLAQALGRLGYTECEIEVRLLDKIGKKMEHKGFTFELPETDTFRNKDLAKKIGAESCPEGWESDLHFGSQGSFFTKDGKQYARTTIRRWVDK